MEDIKLWEEEQTVVKGQPRHPGDEARARASGTMRSSDLFSFVFVSVLASKLLN